MRAFDASGSFATMTAKRGTDGLRNIRGARICTTLWRSQDKSRMTAVWERELGDEPGMWIRWTEMRFDPDS